MFTERLIPKNQTDLAPSKDKSSIISTAFCTECELNYLMGGKKTTHIEARSMVLDLAGDDDNSILNGTRKTLYSPTGHAVKDYNAMAFFNNADKYARTNPDTWPEVKEALRASIISNNGNVEHAGKIIKEELEKTGQSSWSEQNIDKALKLYKPSSIARN